MYFVEIKMESKERMQVVLFSFGFKYGAPADVNMLLDVRFLPNPYWVDDLRPDTGLVAEVAAYVLESDEGKDFIALLKPMITGVKQWRGPAETSTGNPWLAIIIAGLAAGAVYLLVG